MKLIIALITYNRLEYTKRTYKELKDTLKVPHYFLFVDNNSTDGTREWIESTGENKLFNDDNYYPGKATNLGWEVALKEYPEATHLMRCDNDMTFKEGWDIKAEEYFKKIPELGQLGLDHEAIEHPKAGLRVMEINGMRLNPWPGCVGGPNIIRRKIWDLGCRYKELMWNDGRKSPVQEDSQFSRLIQSKGYLTGHMTEDLARTFANPDNWKEYKSYYLETMKNRGYVENVKKLEQM